MSERINLPQQMRCIEVPVPGAAESMQLGYRNLPHPAAGEVLVKVGAAGVNRPDVLQRQGKYPPPAGASDILGLELAGDVVALGAGVAAEYLGRPVCALVSGGAYAEYCCVPQELALPLPAGLNYLQAAAIPETFFTVWSNVFQRGRLQPGENFLVHGGSSGIGTTAIQLARAFGARVFATAGSADKVAACERLGAHGAINYRQQDFVAAIQEQTAGYGVDVILDMVGGDYVARNLQLLAPEGRLLQIAFLQGSRVELDLRVVMLKRLSVMGSTLRARSLQAKQAIAADLLAQVWPLFAQGRIAPEIDRHFALQDVVAAHRLMESNQHIGKLVLVMEA